jgi:two-component system, NtrC family, response regulator GlrR
MGHHLLIIESRATPGEASVQAALGSDSEFQCERLSWEGLLPESVRRKGPKVVVTVAVPPSAAVIAFFRWLRENPIATPTFAVLPTDADELLLQAMSAAADDFVFCPVRAPELHHRLMRILGPAGSEAAAVRERLLEELSMTQLVGRDPVFLKAVEQIPRFACSDLPVLITGETGTGKELCARAIHFLSRRRDYPFVAADCSVLPDHLFENELFGHARGAYTDAHRDQRGLVAMSEGGTLLLDEIDSLSLSAQGKLLRFLQERTFRPLGSDRFVRADVNVIAATNRDLGACVRNHQFRPDLFYRLNVLPLHLPPLRNRRSDVLLLASHFLMEQRTAAGVPARSFAPATIRSLMSYDWPGNVREVHNVVQRAAFACDGPQILPAHLADSLVPAAEQGATDSFRSARAEAVAVFERGYVEDLLRKHGGNVTHAAREAHQDRRAFGRLVKKHGIDRRAL